MHEPLGGRERVVWPGLFNLKHIKLQVWCQARDILRKEAYLVRMVPILGPGPLISLLNVS